MGNCEELISKQAAIDALTQLPSEQPEPIWGLPVSADRPLADVEIVSRLRSIQMQVGGSYAIDRAIEIIEAVAERRTKVNVLNPDWKNCKDRYDDLCDYFNNDPETIKAILWDRKEFRAWLERMEWHVRECNKLARELEKIIHCKDCKYCEHWYWDKGRCFLWVKDGIDVFEDGFCNYGKRKEEGDNG